MNVLRYRIKSSASLGSWNYHYMPVNDKLEELNETQQEWIEYLIYDEIRNKFGDLKQESGYRGFDWEFTDDLPEEFVEEKIKESNSKINYYQKQKDFFEQKSMNDNTETTAKEPQKNNPPKIVRLYPIPAGATWKQTWVGLSDDGTTYIQNNDQWEKMINPIS